MNIDQSYFQAFLKDMFYDTFGEVALVTHDDYCKFVDDAFAEWTEENGDLYTESDLEFAENNAYIDGMFNALED